jgi:hypothetical protein
MMISGSKRAIARLVCCGFATLAMALPNAGADMTYDFLTSDGGFTVMNEGAATGWGWTAGTGWTTDGVSTGAGQNNSYLTSPTLRVDVGGDVNVNFDHAFSFEADWDGGAIFTSVNGGAFTYLDPANFTSNGYNSANPLLGNHVLFDLFAFNADSAGYPGFINSSANLGTFNAGDTIRFQFVGAWDEFVTGNNQPEWILGSATITNASSIPEPVSGLALVIGSAIAGCSYRRKR